MSDVIRKINNSNPIRNGSAIVRADKFGNLSRLNGPTNIDVNRVENWLTDRFDEISYYLGVNAESGAWTPLSITSEVGGMWLKAHAGLFDATTGGSAITSVSGIIKRWEDQSGNGNHVTQATDNLCMLYNDNSYSGIPSLAPEWGYPGYYSLPSGFAVDRRNCSLFLIAKSYQIGAQTYANLGPGVTTGLGLDTYAGNLRNYWVTGSNVNDFTALHPSVNPLLIGCVYGPTYTRGYVGWDTQSGVPIDSGVVYGGKLFQQGGGAASIAAEVYEIIFTPRVLASSEVSQLQTYAANRYGNPVFTNRLFIEGDSLTDGAYSTLGRNWPSQTSVALSGVWQVFSYATSSQTIAQMNSDVAQITALLGTSHPRKETALLGGTNDLGAGESGVITEARIAAWHSAVRAAGATRSYVFTIPARDDTGWSAAKEIQRLICNSGIVANYNSVSYGGSGNKLVNLAADSRFMTPTDTTIYSSDKVHFNNNGFAAIKDIFLTQLYS